jgi:nitrogen-specific signal transduction histidine kinase
MAPPPSVITDTPLAPPVGVPTLRAGSNDVNPPVGDVAFARMVVVVGFAIAGSLWPDASTWQTATFYVWGLGWLPWSILVLFMSDGRWRRFAPAAGFLVDAGVLVVSLAAFPDVPGLFLVALLLALVSGWLTWPGLPRLWSAAALAVLTTAARLPTSPNARGVASCVAFVVMIAVVAVIWMRMDRISQSAATLTSSLRSRAETVLARVPHPLVISDARGRIVSCNPATLEVIGDIKAHAPCCEALGLHYGERALECVNGCALLPLCKDADGGYVEVWRHRQDGTRQPLLASAAEIPDAYGNVLEVVHSIRDITRLKEADEAKTIFLATASHELKTPLTVINGYAQLLLRDDANPSLRKQGLEAISGRAKELAQIVERLLLSSRIESGRLAVTLAPLDLGSVVQDRVEALATATSHLIQLDIESGLPPVDADATATATVLEHLIDNAMKYGGTDAPIEVKLSSHDNAVTLTVADHGQGMGEDQRRHCFDRSGEPGRRWYGVPRHVADARHDPADATQLSFA